MADPKGPWEDYASPAESNPWEDYAPAKPPTTLAPSPAQDKSVLAPINKFLEPKPGEGAITRGLKGLGRFGMGVPNMAQQAYGAIAEPNQTEQGMPAPVRVASRLGVQPSENAAQHLRDMYTANEASGGHPSKLALYGGTALASVPLIGPMALGMGERAAKGDVAGTLAETGAAAATPAIAGKAMEMVPKLARGAAEGLVKPIVKAPLSMAKENAQFGRSPAAGIVDEGLVGTKESLIPKTQAKISELANQTEQTLQNHPNAGVQIDAEPAIDKSIDGAVNAAKRVGNQGAITRLEHLRAALKKEYGPIQGTPLEINRLKQAIGEAGSDLNAFSGQDPIEGSAAAAMKSLYTEVKNLVNKQVPEVAQLNERQANLIGARSAMTRNKLMAEGKPFMDSHATMTGLAGKALNSTLTSAPVRTAIAKMLNFGQKSY